MKSPLVPLCHRRHGEVFIFFLDFRGICSFFLFDVEKIEDACLAEGAVQRIGAEVTPFHRITPLARNPAIWSPSRPSSSPRT